MSGRHYNALDGPSAGKWCLCFRLGPVGHKQRLNWLRTGSAAQQAANGLVRPEKPIDRCEANLRPLEDPIYSGPTEAGHSLSSTRRTRLKTTAPSSVNGWASSINHSREWLFWSFAARVMHLLVVAATGRRKVTHTAWTANELLK